ncbi:MAG: hypothetical protein SOZ97_03260, partial [Lachnospiraceae bacterium]|nr:hypothetical protein [Lachnospiraceae bacterium]
NYINLLLSAAGIAVSTMAVALYIKKINIVPLITIAVTFFLWSYIIVSGLLFWGDCFSISRALGLVLVIDCIAGFMMLRHRKEIQLDFNIKAYVFVLVVIVIALPLIARKYEFFGMGQDEGVYQTQAMNFIYGKNEIQQDYGTYHSLQSEEERKQYKEAMEQELLGLYNYDSQMPFCSEEDEISDVSSVFHGVPTFPALLALSGSIAGIEHMSDIQTVFYMALIIYAYMAMACLNIRPLLQKAMTVVLAFSPLILWVSKSALTEIVIASMMAGFIYFMANHGHKFVYLSCFPVAAFCFLHLTIYTIIPVFLLIYWIAWLFKGEKSYLIASVVSITAFFAGIFMMMRISGVYTFVYNLKPLYRLLPIINQNNAAWFFAVFCIGSYLVTFLLFLVKKDKTGQRCYKKSGTGCRCHEKSGTAQKTFKQSGFNLEKVNCKVVLWAIRILILLFCTVQVYIMISQRASYGGLIGSFQHLSIVGYGICLGIAVPLSAGILWLLKPGIIFDNIRVLSCGILFIYCIMVYSTVLRKDILYYYYYGRYLAPFLVTAVIFSAVILNQVKIGWGLAAGTVSMAVMLPFLPYFVKYQDDTRLTWNILEDMSALIEKEDAVIISDEYMKYYFLPLKAMADAKVYPEFDNLQEEIEHISDQTEGNVYYIHSFNWTKGMTSVYQNTYELSEDNNDFDCRILPFPLKTYTKEYTVVCSRYEKEVSEYNFTLDPRTVVCKGIGGSEGDFAWTDDESVYVECYLDKADYEMMIEQGAKVPLESLSKQEYKIDVYMNDKYMDTLILNEETNGGILTLSISEEDILQGTNILLLKCETWSPEEYGSTDHRNLCIGVKNIVFMKR